MKQVILDTAWEWMMKKPLVGKKIIAKIIEVLTIDKTMKNKDSEKQNQTKDEYEQRIVVRSKKKWNV